MGKGGYIYKYMGAKWALLALMEGRLKLSESLYGDNPYATLE